MLPHAIESCQHIAPNAEKLCPASGSSWQSRETVWHSGVHTVAVEATPRQHGSTAATAWSIVRGAAAIAEPLSKNGRPLTFSLDLHSELRQTKPEDPEAVLLWSPSAGWRSLLTPSDARAELLNLYLPICSATSSRPMTIGHLGQSLDGFIATPSGDSQFVTGDDNIVHLHRMRALSDAVVVGAGTVAADDPQLTVRHVPGANPLRVVFDPVAGWHTVSRVHRRHGTDALVCSRTLIEPGETRMGSATIVGVDCDDASGGVAEALHLLRARGCFRVFVEGGGVTVSAFLQADLLDRLQIAIAPVIIGEGRPAIRLAPTRASATADDHAIACSGWAATCCSTAICTPMPNRPTGTIQMFPPDSNDADHRSHLREARSSCVPNPPFRQARLKCVAADDVVVALSSERQPLEQRDPDGDRSIARSIQLQQWRQVDSGFVREAASRAIAIIVSRSSRELMCQPRVNSSTARVDAGDESPALRSSQTTSRPRGFSRR